MAMTAMPVVRPFIPVACDDGPAVQRHALRDGYLFLPGLLPAAAVEATRRALVALLQEEGWCDGGDRPRAAEGLAGTEVQAGGERFRHLYRRVYGERMFHALPQHPRLLEVVATVVGEPVLVHPRHILRVQTPGSWRWSTPPHQDHFYIHGTLDTWTAWIPLVDCPRTLGGLAVQPGSHRLGPLPVHPSEGAGGRAVEATALPWHCGDFAVGDVLLLHSLCVHQALDNDSPDRLRLSLDCRYQNAAEPVHRSSLQPHLGVCTWDEAYAGWPSDDPLRQYWERMALQVVGA